jgi:outer membrane protein OmpA-like peptidoglycan-associated protein
MGISHIAEILKEHPNYRIMIEGHANPVTTDPNEAGELMVLSVMRSNTVARQLIEKGVREEQMIINAFGGTIPITRERTDWHKNRRVELVVFQTNDDEAINRNMRNPNERGLNHIAEILKEHPDYRIMIEGHAAPVTTDPNEAGELVALSVMQSNTVARQLMEKGVKEEQMVIGAFGGAIPITRERDNWHINSSVELIIFQTNKN